MIGSGTPASGGWRHFRAEALQLEYVSPTGTNAVINTPDARGRCRHQTCQLHCSHAQQRELHHSILNLNDVDATYRFKNCVFQDGRTTDLAWSEHGLHERLSV